MTFNKFVAREIKAEDIQNAIEILRDYSLTSQGGGSIGEYEQFTNAG